MSTRLPLITALTLVLASLACVLGGTPATATMPSPPIPPTETPTAAPAWPTYTNATHGFSISHPPEYIVPPTDSAETFGYLGERVFFQVMDVNLADCLGDCPVVESNTTVEVAGQSATRLSGYIGAVGGNTPQQYITYVFAHNSRFYVFTLYAVPNTAGPSGTTDIVPLDPADVAVFEQMVATLTFAS